MPETAAQTVEASVAAIASKATYTGGAAGLAGFLTQTDWLGLLGVFIALTGLVISFYFSYQRNLREKEEHEFRMKKLRGQCNVED